MSDLLSRFLTEVEHFSSPRTDSYDIRLVEKMNKQDRRAAITKLLLLAEERVPQAIMTLGLLQATEGIPIIAEIAKGGKASTEARRAMIQLGLGDDIIHLLREDVNSGSMIVRFSAVESLGKMSSEEASSLLLSFLSDVDCRVRLHAYEKLLERFDIVDYQIEIGQEYEEVRSPLMQTSLLLGSDLESLHKRAAARAVQIFEGLASGKSAMDLGIIFDGGSPDFVEDLFKQLFDRDAPAPLKHILGGTPHEIEYGKYIACCWIERGDIRMPDLIMQLKVPWAIEVLREAQQKQIGDPVFHQELERVLKLLMCHKKTLKP